MCVDSSKQALFISHITLVSVTYFSQLINFEFALQSGHSIHGFLLDIVYILVGKFRDTCFVHFQFVKSPNS